MNSWENRHKKNENKRKPDEIGRSRTNTGWWGRRMKAQYAERLAQVNNQSAPPQLDFFPENFILTVTAATIGLLTQRLIVSGWLKHCIYKILSKLCKVENKLWDKRKASICETLILSHLSNTCLWPSQISSKQSLIKSCRCWSLLKVHCEHALCLLLHVFAERPFFSCDKINCHFIWVESVQLCWLCHSRFLHHLVRLQLNSAALFDIANGFTAKTTGTEFVWCWDPHKLNRGKPLFQNENAKMVTFRQKKVLPLWLKVERSMKIESPPPGWQCFQGEWRLKCSKM